MTTGREERQVVQINLKNVAQGLHRALGVLLLLTPVALVLLLGFEQIRAHSTAVVGVLIFVALVASLLSLY